MRWARFTPLLAPLLWAAACADSAGPLPRPDAGVADAAPAGDAGLADAGSSDVGRPPAHASLAPSVALEHDLFATGHVCGECHSTSPSATALKDEQGRSVGLFEAWSASAMGNAARDPFFRAVMAREIARAPSAAPTIASVCYTCHAGMGRHAQRRAGTTTTMALIDAASNEGGLARDGVSCALCHQIEPDNLGQDSSFSAGYIIDESRRIFGPYADPFTTPMLSRTGFTPTGGTHIQTSALCGSCHTLVTEALREDGTPAGHAMGEQLTYLEWRRSAFTTDGGGSTPNSCQHCHMPDNRDDGTPLATRLARRPDGTDFPPIAPRSPFSRHTFVGANTLLPKLLRSGRALLSPTASDVALMAAEQTHRDHLAQRTATLALNSVVRSGTALSFVVHIENLAGHKLPTGYPSRRVFLEIEVLDASGSALFHLGRVDAVGRLLDADGALLSSERIGGAPLPHRTHIRGPLDAVVYESVMSDGRGGASYWLLGAEGFMKDNRLLPRGHVDATTGPLSTAPIGVAGDADFLAGTDEVRVELDLGGVPVRVEARLWYQTAGPRYLDEVLVTPTPEATALLSMLRDGMLKPERVAETSVAVP